MATAFKLPELGENIKAGDVVKISVAVGDKIKKDQAVLELETDKAVVEVPSPFAGTITEILVKIGDKAKVGQAVFMIESGETGTAPSPAPAASGLALPHEGGGENFTPPLVGEVAQRAGEGATANASEGNTAQALAAPSVRKLAREIGVDIDTVTGTGPQGRISIDDVKASARDGNAQSAAPQTGGFALPQIALPDFASFGAIERKPMTATRRKTAEHMTLAWSTIPHVTQHEEADITELENLRKQFSKRAEAAGGRLTVTAIALKIIASALKVFPKFNASIDMASQEIIYKKYFHIGVAVDTDRGLIVPVIRDVEKKNIIKLSTELNTIAERARDKKITREEMQGGSFTITNLGGIGGLHFTPIINAPEVAILGMGRWRYQPVFVNNAFEPRKILPISLSYDHRIIDGADAARFLRWVADAMSQPFLMDLEG